ncbi:hypothetical protein NECAME_15848 [Necator americanus]|uniref:Uncharacterized protein n=1 Tax=Necator americanus TaxID=51031 RepID=W2SFK4_NECAM|nr:hypothetical protein NECAME_15848 [Necator americanus]ETN68394.1 hypothetical protein NECAME_15848 [Necator americanus]
MNRVKKISVISMEIREVLEARPQNLIAVSTRLYRECVQRGKRSLSLQQRFQDKENGRTGPVYTSISITELIASISTVVVYACIGAAISEEDGAKYLILSDVLDLSCLDMGNISMMLPNRVNFSVTVNPWHT